ncbi:type 1 periplasmic binding fold superfamily protein [Tenacibaculum xiamenense]|uniref:type 1 periplasmic binding fold superfamily protein n=1 Tax=Tenacibaculum xiamenense TaxID=1261553 RepID=UPI0038953088
MKHIKLLAFLFIATLTFTACSDDETLPEEEHEEEVITNMDIVLTPQSGSVVYLSSEDLDGEGGVDPTITGGTFAANTTYTGVITLTNKAEDPHHDITEEIEEHADEHQFFYSASAGLSSTFAYAGANDSNGNPVGLSFTVTTGDAGTGTYTVTLRHEPNKTAAGVKDGDITNAGGSTDIEIVFPITIQ